MHPRVSSVRLVAALVLMFVVAQVRVMPAAAAGLHYYVDGKVGNDANPGTSLASPLKTVKRALDMTNAAGTTVSVVGYGDYVYYEQLDRPYKLPGTSTSPIVIEGYRPPTGTLIRPVISGALIVNRPGSTRWSRSNATTYPGVWRTPWTTAIRGYESANRPNRMERLFFDRENQLTRPVATPTLADLQARPGSEYWDGAYLYVNLGRWDGAVVDPDPNHHEIVIPNYYGLTVNYLSSWVTIRDLQIMHAAPGIALHNGAHDITVSNVDLSYNYPAGIVSQAVDATLTYVTGRRNTMQLIKLQDGAIRTLIDHATARQHPAQGIKITGNTVAYTQIRSSKFIEGEAVPTWVATYSGEVQGIDIEEGAHDTTVAYNTITGMARGLMLYQLDSAGGPLNNTVVYGNFFSNNLHAVVLWDSRSGGDGSGNATFHHNTYYKNGNAIFAPVTTMNKAFHHETIYLTYEAAGTARAAVLLHGIGTKVTITDSIIAKSPVYAIYAIDGATASVSNTDVWGYATSAVYGSATWGGGNRNVDPAFLSTVVGTSSFLVLPSASPLRTASSTNWIIGSK